MMRDERFKDLTESDWLQIRQAIWDATMRKLATRFLRGRDGSKRKSEDGMNELRQAAERLREMAGTWVDLEEGSVACVTDMWVLAQAYLAEHLPDDDEPITDDWVKSIFGQAWKDIDAFWTVYASKKQGVALGAEDLHDSEISASFQLELPRIKTRGQLRLLCRALGVEIKEESK
jgi:hypothetical protein